MINKFLNSTITVNGKDISFAYAIREAKEISGIVFVVLENASSGKVSEQPCNNVYAIDCNAQLLWNIKDILAEDIFYPGIKIDGDNLIVIDVIGINHRIDVSKRTEISKEGVR